LEWLRVEGANNQLMNFNQNNNDNKTNNSDTSYANHRNKLSYINVNNFPKDTIVFVNRTVTVSCGATDISQVIAKRYRVIRPTATAILLLSLDNDTPQINDTFFNSNSPVQTFSVNTVGNPTVDKYSGQMMFIDNKAAFTPSSQEVVTLRTIIQF
jgi:hypothetical protein